MRFQQTPKMILGIVAGIMLVTLGCTSLNLGLKIADVGPLERESATIALSDVDRVDATIRMATGSLKVKGGADALLDADFSYNVSNWEPQITYDIADSVGRLDIRHADSDAIPIMDEARNDWDLRLNDGVPIDLRVEMGAGDHDLDLEGLVLTELDIKLGAGNMDLTLGDHSELEHVEIDIGAGDVEISFKGGWKRDTRVSIQGGVGKTSLILPQDIGVRVTATQGIGAIDVSGLSREGGAWVNDAYKASSYTMEINIQAGIGEIQIIGD